MCTVVCDWRPGEPVRVLAVRDEFVGRDFDAPGSWWPDRPGVVGGRDRVAGGSWCVTDVPTGVTALVLNRMERRDGTPSRGGLPLAAVAAGPGWPGALDPSTMAAFNLVLAGPDGVQAWTWDATELRHLELAPGTHMVTSSGIDTDDARTARWSAQLTPGRWRDVLLGCRPSSEPSALIVRHDLDIGTYATVFGQVITATPGRLDLEYSRTPWVDGSWTREVWPGG